MLIWFTDREVQFPFRPDKDEVETTSAIQTIKLLSKGRLGFVFNGELQPSSE